MDVPSLTYALLQWSGQEDLEVIVLSRPALGFLRDKIPKVEATLNQRGIRLVELSCAWDENLYAHAGRGFFRF